MNLLEEIASGNATEQTFPQPWNPLNLPPPLPMQPLSTWYQIPSHISPNTPLPQVSGGSLMPGHLSSCCPCTPNSANDQSYMPAFPIASGIENRPTTTIFANTPRPTPSYWDLISPQQQTANISSWCRCLGPQIPRDISGEQTQAHLYRQYLGQHGFYSPTRMTRRTYPCMIPGCSKSFSRSDYRGNHLRKKHHLPIPKGSRAHTWIFQPESWHHVLEAIAGQAREHSISFL